MADCLYVQEDDTKPIESFRPSVQVSVVMPSFNRYSLALKTLQTIFAQDQTGVEVLFVDDGSTDETPTLQEKFPALRYFRLDRGPGWKNPARAVNVGIRQSKGDIIILQGSEVEHVGDVIHSFREAVTADPDSWVFATVFDMKGGVRAGTYCAPDNKRPFWFLCAILKRHLMAINGVDEDYTGPGYDDNDLADRIIQGLGLKPVFRPDIIGEHQEHSRSEHTSYAPMAELYRQKSWAWAAGEISHIRNLDREWGALT